MLVAPGLQDGGEIVPRQDQPDAVVFVSEAAVMIHLPERQLPGVGCPSISVSLPGGQARRRLGEDLQAAEDDGDAPQDIVAQAGSGWRLIRALTLKPSPARIIQPQLLGVEGDVSAGRRR